MNHGNLYGVSVGPGDPELLTLKAASCIRNCGVLAAPRTRNGRSLALEIASGAVDLSGKLVIYLDFEMTRDKEKLAERYRTAADRIAAELDLGRDVSVLNLGDASLYSSYAYLRGILAERGYAAVTIPGVTSFCACAAALNRSLTDMHSPLHILPASAEGLEEALSLPGGKVLMKSGSALGEIKRLLREKGLAGRAALVSDCGLPTQLVCEDIENAPEGGYFTSILIR